MRAQFALILAAGLSIAACDTPRDISYVRATDLDKSGHYAEAARLYRFVAQSQDYSGRQAAEYRLADMYFKGEGVPRNEVEGLRLMTQAAEGPDPSWRRLANFRLGETHQTGIVGSLTRDRIAALAYFEKAAADGNELAPKRITELAPFPDIIVERDKAYYKAPTQGPSPGTMMQAIESFKTSNFTTVLPIFLYYARRGSDVAQFGLALMYENGWGVPKDTSRVRGWTFLAAQGNNAAAQRELGRAFYADDDLVSGAAESEYWLDRAAKQKDVEAVRLLGLVALVPPDQTSKPNIPLALRRFEEAAAQGSTPALLTLGDIYSGELGGGKLGVPRDAEKARRYYMTAADAGHPEARVRLFKQFNIVYDGASGAKPKTTPSTPPSAVVALPRSPNPATTSPRPAPAPASHPLNPPLPMTAAPKPSLVELFATVSPTVVRVFALNIKGKRNELVGQGSAVALRPDLLVTNCHVLDGSNGSGAMIDKQVVIFRRLGGDTSRDLCLMRPDKPMRSIQSTRDFRSLRVGEKVFAIGSPEGLENTISEGIISGLRTSKGIRYIQTSAAIAPGSSGGGLFDENGALIGITTFSVGEQGGNLNFAVAIDESQPIIARFAK